MMSMAMIERPPMTSWLWWTAFVGCGVIALLAMGAAILWCIFCTTESERDV